MSGSTIKMVNDNILVEIEKVEENVGGFIVTKNKQDYCVGKIINYGENVVLKDELLTNKIIFTHKYISLSPKKVIIKQQDIIGYEEL